MKRLLAGLAGLTLLGTLAGLFLTAPQPLTPSERAQRPGDPARGARLFHVGGCASCHAAKGAKGDARLRLGGGAPLVTAFGSFQPPNISPGPDGIGNWSLAEFDNAMRRGISPDGRHYYPAFPYTSYARMTPADIADLFAYITRLPAVAGKPAAGDIPFPFNIRRGIGLWKRLYLDPAPIVALPANASADVKAGQYLVWKGRAIAASATARGTSLVALIAPAGWAVRLILRAKAAFPTSRPASWRGAPPKSPTI